MDIWITFKALIMGVVEGLTEFLPISSTGHLILAGDLLGMNDEKGKVFEVFIQIGAMLAVVVEYRARFLAFIVRPFDPPVRRLITNLILGFLPAAAIGFFLAKPIKAHLFAPVPVAFAFIVGAYIILWVETRRRTPRVETIDAIRPIDALRVGLFQCLALIPGTSRAGATIIGALLIGLSRRAAAEFSFFLAVPTLTAAGLYDLYKHRGLIHASDVPFFAVGSAAAAVSAFICVRFLLRFIATRDFTPFAWYRILFGLLILTSTYFGWINWSVD